MDRGEWHDLLGRLAEQLEVIQSWESADPNPSALRCEHSAHRTLAHLRSCQEQWLCVVIAFLEHNDPSVKILHPWRQFEAEGYAILPWQDHMDKFLMDRRRWLALRGIADWNRGGKWNQKPDTVGGLTKRLADHESHHLAVLNR
ncbi:MAG TPA: hypothetical protein VG820_05665 [Fimbriimonadaceae bacterium]|nr:hypothetical protein [Fimbriimonadaceae bacterium]